MAQSFSKFRKILKENCLIQSFVAAINPPASQPSLSRCQRSCKDKNSIGHCGTVQGREQLLHFDSACAFIAVSKSFNLCAFILISKNFPFPVRLVFRDTASLSKYHIVADYTVMIQIKWLQPLKMKNVANHPLHFLLCSLELFSWDMKLCWWVQFPRVSSGPIPCPGRH